MRRLIVVVLALLIAVPAAAANHYILDGGTGDGTAWDNALDALPSPLTRGDTYYVGDGSYVTYAFDDAENGVLVITIKKATVADHGTATGWVDTYGDGQAVFAGPANFSTNYWVFDGNGTHTTPSDNTANYGFKIAADYGPVQDGVNVMDIDGDYVTIRYAHVFNTYNADDSPAPDNGNCVVGVMALGINHAKFQNNFFENCGQDGFIFDGSTYILFERNYVKEYGKLLTGTSACHGQTYRAWTNADNHVVRWNAWESNEGQSLINTSNGINGFRFYGNVVLNKYGVVPLAGFNSSGGLFHDNSEVPEPGIADLYIYNNTYVNVGGDYQGYANYSMEAVGSATYIYNELHYNVQSNSVNGTWSAYAYNSCGGGDNGICTGGGGNHQTDVASTIFTDYAADTFTLASATTAGLNLAAQAWWSNGADSFFGTVDSAADMTGATRGADDVWDRGAYEYSGAPPAGATTLGAGGSATLGAGGTVTLQ